MAIKAKIATQPTIKVDAGVKGKDGVTFYPSVNENGDLSWTNDGGLSNPQTVNINGKDGANYVLTDADKSEIADTAAETVVNDYAIRETVYIDVNGICYKKDGTPHPMSQLVSKDKYKQYQFVLVYDYTINNATCQAFIPLAIDNNSLGFHLSGIWFSEEEQSYFLMRFVDDTSADQPIQLKFYKTKFVGDYITNKKGELSVNKTALLGDIGDKTMKEYVDDIFNEEQENPRVEDVAIIEGGYVSSTGVIKPAAGFGYTSRIDVEGYYLLRIHNAMSATSSPGAFSGRGAFFKSDGTFISYIQHNQQTTLVETEIPTEASYAIINIWFDGVDVSTFYVERFKKETDENSVQILASQYFGKKWVSLGDSITYQEMWQPFVANALQMTHVNCGIGSTCLAGGRPNAFWTADRLDAVKAENPDVVTILGGANDIVYGYQIGTEAEFTKALAEKDTTTFVGAYSYIVETLLTWKPTLKIVLLTTTFAHNDGTTVRPEGSTTTYKDFADATKLVAEYYGLPCADLRGKTGFNALTMSTFSQDNIHPNSKGGERISAVVLGAMICG